MQIMFRLRNCWRVFEVSATYKECTVKNKKLLTHMGTGAQREHGRNRKNPLQLVLIHIGEEIVNQENNNDNDRTHVKKKSLCSDFKQFCL